MIVSKAVVVPTLILDLTMALGSRSDTACANGFPAGAARRSDGDRASAAAFGVEPAGTGTWLRFSSSWWRKQPFHAPECYLNLLSAISSCPDSEGACRPCKFVR